MNDLSNQNLFEKEAAGNPLRFLNRKVPIDKREGKFVTDIGEQVGADNARYMHFFDKDEIQKQVRQEVDEESNGFVADITRFTTGLAGHKFGVRGKINDGLFEIKKHLTKVDTKVGEVLAGKDPTSWRGKSFSTRTGGTDRGGVQIGIKKNMDGSSSPIMEGGGIDRRPSAIGPYSNTAKFAAPLLGAAFVGEKLYPAKQENVERTASTFFEQMEKKAENDSASNTNHGILEEEYASHMDKQASMQKIAKLEDELEKTATLVNSLTEEKNLLAKEASYEREQKEQVRSNLHDVRKTLIEKQAHHDEFRLRILARERSTSAIKLAEDMLDVGIIKQANFDNQVDKLMDCDEQSFNLYASMVKQAKNDEEGLESLAFMVDYKSNGIESIVADNQKGLSKRGQTIGEAARDLTKK